MRYATTPQVSKLTGLSTATLREWTNRRALIPADILPAGKGSPAQFTWQTVLIIRVAASLKNGFHLQLQAHQSLFASLRAALHKTSFVGLWNKVLVIDNDLEWTIVCYTDAVVPANDALFIQLNPHLEILSSGFAFPQLASAHGQFSFFPTQSVDNVIPKQASERDKHFKQPNQNRRNLA